MEEHRDLLEAGTLLDGKYRIERVLGSGGFGITYEATDLGLDTKVAVKEYYPASFATRDSTRTVRPISGREHGMFQRLLQSFLREARTLARFDSPAIVRVNNVFEAHGTAYMVMRYEPGPSLKAWRANLDRTPTQEEMDRITAPLLDALETLHKAEFLHRDVAPDNIIVRPDGTPVLLDFGASRRVMGELTSNLTAIVKPGFSPPEQYTADAKLQGPWTDIYALGATIFQIVTDTKPTEASQRMGDRIDAATELLAAGMRPGYADAIDAALEFRPENRPQTIADWREMLFEGAPRTRSGRLASLPRPSNGRSRNDDDDVVPPEPPLDHRVEVLQPRRPQSTALVWLGGGTAAIVLALATWVAIDQFTKQSHIGSERAAAIARQKAADEARARAAAEAAAEEARRSAAEEARGRAAAAEEARRRAEDEARRRAEEEARIRTAEEARLRAEEARRKADEEARARAAALAEEARRKAEEEARARVAAEEARRRAEEERARAAEEARRRAEEEARARTAALAEEEARRRAEEEARRQAELQPRQLPFTSPVQDDRPIAVAAAGNTVAAGGHSGHLRFWTLPDGRAVDVAEPHRDQVTAVAISPDGSRVAAGSWNGELRIYETATGRLDRIEPAANPDNIRAMRYVARDQLLVAHASGRVRTFNPDVPATATAQRAQSTFALPGGSAPTAAIANDGTRIAAATTDGSIAYWNPQNGQAVGQPLRGHKDWPLAIAFSRDGRRLASGAADGSIRLWELTSRQSQELRSERSVRALAFSPDGRLLATAGDDNTVTVWNVTGPPRVLGRLTGHRDTVRGITFDGDGRRIVTAGEDGDVRVWSTPQ